jgi:type IV pilus assembly protein PilX
MTALSHLPRRRVLSSLAFQRPTKQKGVAMVTVLVMMLLSLLLVMGGSRVGLLNERVSGNSTDYQRAFEAAEAVLAEARLDLACRGRCGFRAAPNVFPSSPPELEDLKVLLALNNPPCVNGICNDLGAATNGNVATSFWANPAQFAAFTAAGRPARFGEWTGTAIVAAQAVNPQLLNNTWYWIELLPYDTSSPAGKQQFPNGRVAAPTLGEPWLYRVTVVSQGRRPGTQVVLQAYQFFAEP